MSLTTTVWRVLTSRELNLLIGIAGVLIGIYGIWSTIQDPRWSLTRYVIAIDYLMSLPRDVSAETLGV
jgi:hypothetical protein